MKSGLVSISFRKKEIKEIIKEAKKANLDYIEWGGDVHIPMGNVKLARRVNSLMHGSGLKSKSYGSYYGVVYHCGEGRPMPFKYVLKTAKQLGADNIRIWAGWPCCGCTKGKGVYVCQSQKCKAISVARELCNEAKKHNMTLSIECHFSTITDDYHDTLDFIKSVGCDNLRLYWQPNHQKSFEYNIEALKALLPYITNVHVFNWEQNGTKHPLSEGKEQWRKYIEILDDENAENRIFFLEFMPDGEISSLAQEAKTLNELLAERRTTK